MQTMVRDYIFAFPRDKFLDRLKVRKAWGRPKIVTKSFGGDYKVPL